MYFRMLPGLILFPGLFLSLTVLSVNILGDALRDALDQKWCAGPDADDLLPHSPRATPRPPSWPSATCRSKSPAPATASCAT